MNALSSVRFLREFLFEFGTIFAIINPYGLAFIFLERTNGLSARDRSEYRPASFHQCVCSPGGIVLRRNIDPQLLRHIPICVAHWWRSGGGFVWMGYARRLAREQSTETRPATNLELVKKMAFFPFTMPLTTGPGTIAASIALAANRHDGLHGTLSSSAIWIFVAAAVSLTIFHAYARANVMARLFGADGTRIVTRLSAFLLLCVGVQIVTTGVSDVLRQLVATLPP